MAYDRNSPATHLLTYVHAMSGTFVEQCSFFMGAGAMEEKMGPLVGVLATMGNLESIQKDMTAVLGCQRVSDIQKKNLGVHCSLAPSFGSLNKESCKLMDQQLLLILAGTLRSFEKDPKAIETWEGVLSVMNQNSLLVKEVGTEINKRDGYNIDESHDLKFDGSAEQGKIDQFVTWFEKFISDDDVLKDTKINVRALANIIAQTGATVDSVASFFEGDERHEATVIDVGIMRFPEIAHPHIKVYRIKLHVWSHCHRTLFHQDDHNGVRGEFDSVQYVPNKEIIAAMKPEIMKKGVSEAESLFG